MRPKDEQEMQDDAYLGNLAENPPARGTAGRGSRVLGSGRFTVAELKEKAAQLMIRNQAKPRSSTAEWIDTINPEGVTMGKKVDAKVSGSSEYTINQDKSIKVTLTAEDLALVYKVVDDHHRHSEAVLNPTETPEQQARFRAIGDYDEVPVPGLSLRKDQWLATIKLWENRILDTRYDQWVHGCYDTSAMGMEDTRDGLIEQVAAQIGIEAVWKALDEAFDAFDLTERHSGGDGPALWRCYLAEKNPEKYGPADPEALAARARLDEALGGEPEPVNSMDDDYLSTP